MSEIFEFQEPVYQARLYQLGDAPINQYFWGPKSLVLDADTNYSSGQPITNSWFVKYLIPQSELLLAVSGNTETVIYNERARINKVITNTGDEL